MKVIVVPNTQELGRVGASLIAEQMGRTPNFVLGLATGGTPVPVYEELCRRHREEGLDFSTVATFNLDEYVGLSPDHPQSYRTFMNKNLFDRVNINKANTRVPDGLAEDSAAHCAQYEACIEKVGGIDCQVLGIGANGHIGFNEPGSSLASRTRRVKLTPQTREDNARFFARLEDVPTEAITMGIGTVLECRRILLFASGPNKAKAVADALEGPVTVKAPASALQLHPDVTFILTQDSASQLTLDFARS